VPDPRAGAGWFNSTPPHHLSEPPAPLTDILPFIGTSYENADRTTFRVTTVGINVSDGDWPKDRDEKRGWYPRWWRAAGHARTNRFFEVAGADDAPRCPGQPASGVALGAGCVQGAVWACR
jgi:hypothetical protein